MEKEQRMIKEENIVIQKIETWMLDNRLILSFFDRLARRLIVEKTKEQLTGETAHSYNRAILSCLVFERRLIRQLIKETKVAQQFQN